MFCSECGKENSRGAIVCANCGSAMSPEGQQPSSSKTGWCVAGGICAVMFLIIPVMAAILFPVFARAREAARQSSCQCNMKELGTAVVMYCGDYDGMLPSSKLYNGSAAWNSQDFVNFAKSAKSPQKSYPVLIENYCKSTKDIFWCSSDPNQGNTDCVSYYWKAAVDAAWYQGSKKEADFAYPADQILLYEHNGWHWGDAGKGLTDGVSLNVVYMDGHVATKRIVNSGYSFAENPPGPLPMSGVGEPAWFNCKVSGSVPVSSVGKFCDPATCYDELR